MAKDLEAKLVLTAVDNASKVVKDTAKNAEKAFKDTERAAQQSGNSQTQAAQKAANATENSNRKIEQSYRNARQVAADVSRARETLGVRAENAIQREIEQTRVAYDRLKRSGVASQNELRRASEATKQRVRELNAELGKTSFGDKAGSFGRGLMSAGVGVAAGAAMVRQPARNQMEFDKQLAMAANTAFSDRDVKGRIEGKKELLAAVQEAVTVGGGTKEDALLTLDTLIASGTMKAETAMNLLPTLQKGAVGTGASSEDMAKIVISSMQQFGIKEEDIGRALDMAVAAGQAGNFELKDMARWLPQQMAAGKSIGLRGLEGLETLLVANQQARVTAGSSDEAGNNLVNLLAKITSKETTDRLEKIKYKGSDGKVKSIDYLKSMEHYKGKGQDSLQAFMSVMEDTVVNNGDYKALQQRIKTAKGEEAQKLLEQMTDLIEATAVGQVISDRQALMALVALRNNKELGDKVKSDVKNSEGAVEQSHAVIRDTNSHKVEALKNATEFAQMENFEKVNGVLGTLAEHLTSYANQYPNLTQFVSGATDAVKIFGAALAASSVMDLLTSGKGGKGSLVSSAIDAATSRKGIKWGVGGLGVAAAGVGLYAAAENSNKAAAKSEADKEKHSEAIKQFHQENSPKTTPTFRYGVPSATPMPTTQYHGGYVIADRLRNNEIGQERVKQGSLSLEELKARNERNQSIIQEVKTPPPSKPIGVVQGELSPTPTLQQTILQDLRPNVGFVAHQADRLRDNEIGQEQVKQRSQLKDHNERNQSIIQEVKTPPPSKPIGVVQGILSAIPTLQQAISQDLRPNVGFVAHQADRLRNNEIGQERVKQDSLSLEELKARNERNQSIIQEVKTPPPSKPIGIVQGILSAIPTLQQTILQDLRPNVGFVAHQADRLRDNEIGQEQVKQRSQLKDHNERNQSIIQEVKTPPPSKPIGVVQGILSAIPTLQQTILQDLRPKVDSVSNALATYQADFQAFGATISAGLEAGLASQSHTIANQITVELEGSVVAEKVAEYQFNFNKRMA